MLAHVKTLKVSSCNTCVAFKNLPRPRVAHHRGAHLESPKAFLLLLEERVIIGDKGGTAEGTLGLELELYWNPT